MHLYIEIFVLIVLCLSTSVCKGVRKFEYMCTNRYAGRSVFEYINFHICMQVNVFIKAQCMSTFINMFHQASLYLGFYF